MKQRFLIIILLIFSAHCIYGQTKKVVRQKKTPVVTKQVKKHQGTSRRWISLSHVHEGLVRAYNYNYKYGFVDKTGKTVIPFMWDDAFDSWVINIYIENIQIVHK